jgi:mannitol-1-phosphate/altronate dehydrogenase
MTVLKVHLVIVADIATADEVIVVDIEAIEVVVVTAEIAVVDIEVTEVAMVIAAKEAQVLIVEDTELVEDLRKQALRPQEVVGIETVNHLHQDQTTHHRRCKYLTLSVPFHVSPPL